ncbi:MAG TPA: DUF5996 family protein [Vicinamibacterales bacterium]|jgi:hypothetical protein
MPDAAWPDLPLVAWKDTCDTLHIWTQVVGKICLALTPPLNHFWNATLHVTPRGLATPIMPCALAPTSADARDTGAFWMHFDFVDHALVVQRSDGVTRSLELRPRSVAEFYRHTRSLLAEMDIAADIWPVPVEVPSPIHFELDTVHASYDPDAANRFWRILLRSHRVFEAFRARFIGKCSPVHFFWGSFDLAVTRFSGRPAPERPGADPITREAYSHEVISHGFWPGGGSVPDAAFYAYAAPEPAGLKDVAVLPTEAYYSRELSEFLLPYDAVRTARHPDAVLTQFLESTYQAAADLARWDRAGLERPVTEI